MSSETRINLLYQFYYAVKVIILDTFYFNVKMAESSSDSDFEDFQFYRDRDNWKDVIPVSQNDGDHAVVRIAYSDECMSLLCNFKNSVISFVQSN